MFPAECARVCVRVPCVCMVSATLRFYRGGACVEWKVPKLNGSFPQWRGAFTLFSRYLNNYMCVWGSSVSRSVEDRC